MTEEQMATAARVLVLCDEVILRILSDLAGKSNLSFSEDTIEAVSSLIMARASYSASI